MTVRGQAEDLCAAVFGTLCCMEGGIATAKNVLIADLQGFLHLSSHRGRCAVLWMSHD